MTHDPTHQYPIQDPDHLRRIAEEISRRMGGTDDAPRAAVKELDQYPPLYAAALGVVLAKISLKAHGRDDADWMARFLLAVAQNRVRSVFEMGDGPYWPEWMER